MTQFRLRALLAFLLIGGFLLFGVFKNESARSNGAEIVLETRPIDPRDVFFGHYAILSYDIEALGPARVFALLDDEMKAEARRRIESDVTETGRRRFTFDAEPVFVSLEKRGAFHVPLLITQNLTKAAISGTAVLKARWRPDAHFRECEEGRTAGIDCAWTVSISLDLPDRYYADKETALALENRQRDAQRIVREQRRFEQCERALAEGEGGTVVNNCDGATAPEAAERFGVILSVSDAGDAVIKGVMLGEERIYDSLTGPRLTTEDLAQ